MWKVLFTLGAIAAADTAWATPEPAEGALVRMGGEAAVPLPERGPRAPESVVIAPSGGPAIAHTEGGAFGIWNPEKGVLTAVPIRGERLIAVSPTGGSVLTGGPDGKVQRWRIGSWEPLADLEVVGPIEEARFSHDGHHLFVASQGPEGRRFTLFGGSVGLALKRIDRVDAPFGAPIAVATSRAAFVAKSDRAIAVYSLPRLEALREVPLDSDSPLRALSFASDTELVGVQGGRVLRWDTENGKVVSSVRLPEKCARLALTDDGSLAVCAGTSDKGAPVMATLVDTSSGVVRSTFRAPGRGEPVFDPGGLRVAFPGNAAVPVWEVTIDGVSTTLPPGAVAGTVRQLAVVGTTVVALEDGLIRGWDPATLAEAWRAPTSATSVAVVQGKVALAGKEGLSIYDPATGSLTTLDKKSRYQTVSGAANSDLLSLLAEDGRVWVRALADKRARVAMARAKKDRGLPGVLAVAHNGTAVFAEGRLASLPPARVPKGVPIAKTARLATWLGIHLVLVEGDTPRIVEGPTFAPLPRLTAIAGSTDGMWLALGGADGKVIVLDSEGRVRMERVAHRGAVTALAFDLATQRIYSAGEDGAHSLILGWGLPK